MINEKSALYKLWLRNLLVGDEVVVTGALILISPLYRSVPLVCYIHSKSIGAICPIEKINDRTIKIAGRYFSLENGVSSSTMGKYRLQIFPAINLQSPLLAITNNLACETVK